MSGLENLDHKVVVDFGREWSKFNHRNVDQTEMHSRFMEYFSVFDISSLPKNAIVADIGCGSGRWTSFVAPHVGTLYAVDPSERALDVARSNLVTNNNVKYLCESVSNMSIADNSLDFAYSLGVLHHIPDIKEGLKSIRKKLKDGAPFVCYLYYALENRPIWFSLLWRISNVLRNIISRLPFFLKNLVCDIIAILIYFPLSRLSRLVERIGFSVENFPLSYYRNCSFYTLKTDALDRFGTGLEKRFSKSEIETLLRSSGFHKISFRDKSPYWVSVAYKAD